MSNTARPIALLVGTALREPLAKLGAPSFELGVSIRRQVTAIILGLTRLDAGPERRRSARRTRVCAAVTELFALVRAGRSLGDISEPDYQRVLTVLEQLVDAIVADVLAEAREEDEARKAAEAAEVEAAPELDSGEPEEEPLHLTAEAEAPF